MANEFQVTNFDAGTVGAPTITFGDSSTGWYRTAANQWAFAVSGTQRILLGTTAKFRFDVGVVRDAATAISIESYIASAGHGRINFFAARGTESSPAALSNADTVGDIYGRSWGSGTTFVICSRIQMRATQNHSAIAMGTELVFYTTPNDSVTAAVGFTIGQDKKLTGVGDFEIPSANAIYIGSSSTDGSWRLIRDGNDLKIQRRELTVWTTKETIAAA